MQRVKLGGDRLGSGNKMNVELEGYGRSNHNLSYKWRSSMSAGTLVPFMKLVAMPGDTFDVNLQCEIQTHPTVGPLFGSFKVQLDVFTVPMRLYNSLLHNNKMKIGLQMNKVYFPIIELKPGQTDWHDVADIDNSQINPSCILAYLGIRGIGYNDFDPDITRKFNATPWLAYWEIYKQYYANLMEEVGYVIHNGATVGGAITSITINGNALPNTFGLYMGSLEDEVQIVWATATPPNRDYILFNTSQGEISATNLFTNWSTHTGPDRYNAKFNAQRWGQLDVFSYRIAGAQDNISVQPTLTEFSLANIDNMREELLAFSSMTAPFNVAAPGNAPYEYLTDMADTKARLSSQEGLGVKTYQSDLFNNWLNTEYIDGPTGINEITKIDTTGDEFTIQQFILAKKVYDLLNRVAVSGGSYRDWIQAVYDDNRPWIPETPVYEGGLIKELVFQEVIGQSASETQPLGTLGGRGVLNGKHKGGRLHIKVAEPSYIMGIVSLTPRVEYSQGNDWDVYELQTLDDIHKPGMDGIGFQDLITEQMAWWSTEANSLVPDDEWVQKSAGKQPAWINYMTSVDKVLGNFAIESNEMFMVLNRRYEIAAGSTNIGDLTTYIDPAKYNYIFAQTSLDAQNFWVGIGCQIEARRVMSTKVMPNI